jgi:outer membrane protein assembly factor BamB
MRLSVLPLVLAAMATSPLLVPAVLAQSPGERLWAVDVENILTASGYTGVGQPRVGPDGTIYVGADSLYALYPDGRVRWTAPIGAGLIDIGPDGTIYTAWGHTVYAYAPDGAERWHFTDPGGWGITTGPTVGPDGNVYAVTIQGGLGAFSLTPEGELRWSVPGFFTSDGVESGRVAFGPDNMYYADGTLRVEGCGPPHDGLVSISLDGDLEWCHAISGVFDPPNGVVATLDGRGIVQQNALPGIDMQAYRPDGGRDWVQTFRTDGIGVGPDNNLYMFIVTTLVSLTADGEPRWSEAQPINNFPQDPVVAPDLSALVAGSSYGFGENGRIIAADPADGHTLWSIPVTGPAARPRSRRTGPWPMSR